MDEPVASLSGIEIGEADRRTAAALAEAARAAAELLPFGLEPQDFAAALERLAEPPAAAEPPAGPGARP